MALIDDIIAEARTRNALPPAAVRRAVREQAGLTQAEVAHVLGVTRPAVTRWENGGRTPRGALCARYAAVLDRLAREARQ